MIQFEEIQPAADCPCAGCAARRRERRSGGPCARDGGHAARTALVLVTAAGAVLGGGGAAGAAPWTPAATERVPHDQRDKHDRSHKSDHRDHGAHRTGRVEEKRAEEKRAEEKRAGAAERAERRKGGRAERRKDGREARDVPVPQGRTAPLHGGSASASASRVPGATGTPGPSGVAAAPKLKPATRAQIIKRAQTWVAAGVPYSMDKYWSDGYRQDCSGYVSMAWGLPGNEWTGSLAQYGVRVPRDQLQPGDILLFHNTRDPHDGSHVTIFGGWTDYTHDHYLAYEQTRPKTRHQATPLGYWNNADRYLAYRYKGLVGGAQVQGAPGAPVYPGARYFRPGQSNAYVKQLGQRLTEKGFGRHYTVGPGPRWTEADRRNVEAFQRAQGWRGAEADGYPGPETWRRLFATTATTEGAR
ncbi:peptidoglycan-binding protein [Streptomyces sp. NPDC088745]|uniref:peptidoglycan-binding protein n=1 Tax=Streptomyces sp. NPDC088745 TaxID=3365884 RepID=UPI003819F49B